MLSLRIPLPVFEEEDTPPLTDHQIYMLEMGLEPTQSLHNEQTTTTPYKESSYD